MGLFHGVIRLNTAAMLTAFTFVFPTVHSAFASSSIVDDSVSSNSYEERRLEIQKQQNQKRIELAKKKRQKEKDDERIRQDKLKRKEAMNKLRKDGRDTRLNSYSTDVQAAANARKKKIADEQKARQDRIKGMQTERDALAAKLKNGSASKRESNRYDRLGRRIKVKQASSNLETITENRRMARKDKRDLKKINDFDERLADKNKRDQEKLSKAHTAAQEHAEANRLDHEAAMRMLENDQLQTMQRQKAFTVSRQQKATQKALDAQLVSAKAANTKAQQLQKAATLVAAQTKTPVLTPDGSEKQKVKKNASQVMSVGSTSVTQQLKSTDTGGGFANNSASGTGSGPRQSLPVNPNTVAAPLVADSASLGHGLKQTTPGATTVTQPQQTQVIVVQQQPQQNSNALAMQQQWYQTQQNQQKQQQQLQQQQMLQQHQEPAPVVVADNMAPLNTSVTAPVTYGVTVNPVGTTTATQATTSGVTATYKSTSLEPPVSKEEKVLLTQESKALDSKPAAKVEKPADLTDKTSVPTDQPTDVKNAEATQHAAKFCKGRTDYVECVETEKRAYLGVNAATNASTTSADGSSGI